jgi:hypothetical protein
MKTLLSYLERFFSRKLAVVAAVPATSAGTPQTFASALPLPPRELFRGREIYEILLIVKAQHCNDLSALQSRPA